MSSLLRVFLVAASISYVDGKPRSRLTLDLDPRDARELAEDESFALPADHVELAEQLERQEQLEDEAHARAAAAAVEALPPELRALLPSAPGLPPEPLPLPPPPSAPSSPATVTPIPRDDEHDDGPAPASE